ncbi:hypothetical protein D9M71_577690 [compost metagenome]
MGAVLRFILGCFIGFLLGINCLGTIANLLGQSALGLDLVVRDEALCRLGGCLVLQGGELLIQGFEISLASTVRLCLGGTVRTGRSRVAIRLVGQVG